MRPPFPALLATALGCVALLVVSCSSTEAPREPGEAALSFDVQEVIRDVTAQAGPPFAPEVPVDSPVYSTASFTPRGHKVAYGGGIYLVVWSFEYYEVSWLRHQIMATRVRAVDGAVLDPGGLVLASNVYKEPSLDVASDGTNFLVTWEAATEPINPHDEPYNPDSSIFARRVSGTTGAPLDPAPSRVSPSSWGRSKTPAVAFDGSHYLVVWSWNDSLIQGARVRASDGAVVDPDGLFLSSAPGARFFPSVAFSAGHYLVAWQDHRSSRSEIYCTRVRASDGVALEPDGTDLGFGIWDDARMPVVAARDGIFLVVWLSWQSSALDGVRVAASDGQQLEYAFRITKSPGSSRHALVSAGTHFQLMWSELAGSSYHDLFGVKIPVASGAPFDSKRLTASDTDHEVFPALAMGQNQLMAVWFEPHNTQQLLALRMEPSGMTALDAQPLLCSTEANAQLTPAVAVGTSNTLVVWADSRNRPRSSSDPDRYDIYGVRVGNADGVVLDPTPIPIARAVNSQTLPVVAFDGSNYLVVWMDGGAPGSSHVVRGARVRASDGVVLDPTGVDVSSNNPVSPKARPALAFGGGAYLVTWVSADATAVRGAHIRVVDGALVRIAQFPVSSLEGAVWPHITALGVAYAQNVFLAVWDDLRGDSSNIYGMRIRVYDGKPMDPAALALNTMPGHQLGPSVASSGSAFLVAWRDQRSGEDALYGTRVNPGTGKIFEETGLALNTLLSLKGPPSVAFDGVNYVVAWSNGRPAMPVMKLTRVTPQGMLMDGTGQVVTEIVPDFYFPSRVEIAALGRRQFLVAYARYDDGLRQPRLKYRWLPAIQPNGAACTGGSECASGICNQGGVCCDRRCTAEACGGGTCTDPVLRITCPADPVAEAASASGAVVSYQAQVQGPGRLSVAYSPYSGTRFSLGTTPVTATVTDILGQKESCSFQVHVRDTTAPTLSCPAPVTARASSLTGANVNYPPATASDSVSPVTLGYSQVSGARFAMGTTAVTVTGTDAAGNTSTCGFEVTVGPPAPPQVTCPADVRAEATSASGSVVYYAPATAQGAAPLALSYSRASGTRIGLGTTPITATVTDGAGQTASCVFQVHVRDTTEPSLSCPAPVTAEATSPSGATVSYPPATAADRVSPVTLGYSQESGTHFAVGTTPVTVTATDTSGNASTCDFTVTVRQSASSSEATW